MYVALLSFEYLGKSFQNIFMMETSIIRLIESIRDVFMKLGLSNQEVLNHSIHNGSLPKMMATLIGNFNSQNDNVYYIHNDEAAHIEFGPVHATKHNGSLKNYDHIVSLRKYINDKFTRFEEECFSKTVIHSYEHHRHYDCNFYELYINKTDRTLRFFPAQNYEELLMSYLSEELEDYCLI